MIPLLSIIYSICTTYSFLLALKLYFSWKRTKDSNIKRFMKAASFLTINMFLVSLPGIAFFDLKTIGLIFAIYPFFTLVALAYFTSIPLYLLGWQRAGKIVFSAMLIIVSLITIFNIINLKPSVSYLEPPFIFWEDNRGITVNILIGVVIITSTLLCIPTYILSGLRATEKIIRFRAFLMTAAILCYLLTAISNFVLTYYLPQRYIGSVISGILQIFALSFLLLAIMYPRNNEQTS